MATALNAGLRLTAARPTAGFTAARHIAARSAASRFTPPCSAASRFTPSCSAASRFTAPRSAASYFMLPRSVCFTPHPGGTRLLGQSPLRCAADAPPPLDNTPPPPLDNTPPPPPLSKWQKLWKELKPRSYSLLMFFIALVVGTMASKENPKKMYTDIVTLCEKSEKIHKVLSHLIPVVEAIVKSFW